MVWLFIATLSFIHLLIPETLAVTEIGVAVSLCKLVFYGFWLVTGFRLYSDYKKPEKADITQEMDGITFRWQTGGVRLWMILLFTVLAITPQFGMIPVLMDGTQTNFPDREWPYMAHIFFINATSCVTLLGTSVLAWQGTGMFVLRLSHTQWTASQSYGFGMRQKIQHFATATSKATLMGATLTLKDGVQKWPFIQLPKPDRVRIKETFDTIENNKSVDVEARIPAALQQLRDGTIGEPMDTL